MPQLFLSSELRTLLEESRDFALELRHEFITPEHILLVLLSEEEVKTSLEAISPGSSAYLEESLSVYMDNLELVPEDIDYEPEFSVGAEALLQRAAENAAGASRETININHLVYAFASENSSEAARLLASLPGFSFGALLELMLEDSEDSTFVSENDTERDSNSNQKDSAESPKKKGGWHSLVTSISDLAPSRNPLVGRESELERTIRVLCRKDKNNPLHIGEPGVGKTALIYGLARMIEEGKVPSRLQGAKIYGLDMGSLVAGTRMRGDFEERLDAILKGAAEEGNVILYIDEIHTMMGAGATSDSSLDASNILKPYLEDGRVRFIGATTFEDNKRSFARNKALSRRFQEIEIAEPSVSDTIEILRRLQPHYEEFHGVRYAEDAVEFAAEMSARHIRDRFLPDKAIDLMDEAGAYRQIHPDAEGRNVVGKDLVADILARIAKVDSLAMKEEQTDLDARLAERILARVYGQDKAVEDVVEAVLMARAGLQDGNKPTGSFLFVGPTGVGKTELARVLAEELGIGLVRFDMSEYTEKHSVAKLIGAPAGYVGYDDGGILTDAIRKTPNCVLLLDEIEKAHSDIYNILLQVMDYGRLTDNRGNATDFSNVILIMTSNAGAQFASRARLGFESRATPSSAMAAEVKRLFKPEFINRLNGVVAFNAMNEQMTESILDKFLANLRTQLKERHVALELSGEARRLLLKEGFTKEYGARELGRVLERRLKRPLSREILFGGLRNGGKAKTEVEEGEFKITISHE